MTLALSGKKVVVMGLGKSGRAAATLAARLGGDVVGVDLRTGLPPIEGVALELGPHRRQTFLSADVLVVSPGIPMTQSDLWAAAKNGADVVGELAFALRFIDIPVAAVTGTNGKSTVTWFAGQLLNHAGIRAFAGGNLGTPLSTAVGKDYEVLVVEVSSYQMEWPGRWCPEIAVVLNLTPDHLGRHGNMDTYGGAKCRLFRWMSLNQLAMIPMDDPRLRRLADAAGGGQRVWLGAHPGVIVEGRTARIRVPGIEADLSLDGFQVPGAHNLGNAAVAALIALRMGATVADVQRGVDLLEALPHRMEPVCEVGGVLWINDSKATNVEAALVGLRGLDRRAVVLLGGQAKGDGFIELESALRRHRAVVTFGASGGAIADELLGAGLKLVRMGDMGAAMEAARGLACAGDAVLLSPGCASFDEFDNFEHRGDVFRDRVLQFGGDR